jgi:hypothetical protein
MLPCSRNITGIADSPAAGRPATPAPDPNSMVAATMQLERHERGIHVVSTDRGPGTRSHGSTLEPL